MNENQDKIDQLLYKLDLLLKRQDGFSREINNLSNEINRLKASELKETSEKEVIKEDASVVIPVVEIKKEQVIASDQPIQQAAIKDPQSLEEPKASSSPKIKIDLEKFIGENLINKIGIAITVIGVGIGAKYSIEHDLVSPLTRIILGYLEIGRAHV